MTTSKSFDSLLSRADRSAGGPLAAWGWVSAAIFAYAALYVVFHEAFGRDIVVLSVIPAVLAGLWLGPRSGAATAVLTAAANAAGAFLVAEEALAQAVSPSAGWHAVLAAALGSASGLARTHWTALKASEERFRAVVEHMSEGVALYNGSEVLLSNASYVRIRGNAPGDEPGPQAVDEAIHPDDRAMIADRMRAREAGAPIPGPVEYRVRRPDGRWAVMQREAVALKYHGRNATVALMRDITEHREAQAALKASEERFRTLLDSMAESIVVGAKGRRLFVNRSFVEIMGYRSKEEALAGSPPAAPKGFMITEGEGRLVIETVSRVERERQGPERIEYAFVGEETTRYMELLVVPVDYEGQAAILTVGRETTDRHQAQAALAESEELYRAVIESMRDAVMVYAGQERLMVNQAYVDLFGLSNKDQALHESPLFGSPRIHPDDRNRIVAFRRRVESGEAVVPPETYRIIPKGGAEREVETVGAQVIIGGRKAGLAVIRDVTERSSIERMKSDLTAVVSHELRTPLTSLHASLALLDDGRVDLASDTGKQLITIGLRNSQRLWNLVDDILEIERIGSGGLRLKVTDVDTASVVERAVESMAALAQDRGVRVEGSSDAGTVPGDDTRVVSVLANLLSNAIKFTGPGTSVSIVVAQSDREVVFSVTDAGPGIPEDQWEAIFDRYYQIDGTSSRDQGGSGLGLAICKGIVERHGGRIWVENNPGPGSTFRFALPLQSVLGSQESEQQQAV